MAREIPSLTPDSDFYESPYVPSVLEMDDYRTVPISAVEANTLLVNSAGKNLSPAVREALIEASGIDGDETVDLKGLIKRFEDEIYGG